MLLTHGVAEAPDEHIDMTPMVDVVFQLMTFMLFTLQMSGGDTVVLPQSRHGIGVEETHSVVLTLIPPAEGGVESRIFIGDLQKNGDIINGPTANEQDIRDAVLDGLANGNNRVVLQADGNVAYADVLRAASAVDEIEGITLHVVVQEPD